MLRSLVVGKLGGCGCTKTIDEARKRLAMHVGGLALLVFTFCVIIGTNLPLCSVIGCLQSENMILIYYLIVHRKPLKSMQF